MTTPSVRHLLHVGFILPLNLTSLQIILTSHRPSYKVTWSSTATRWSQWMSLHFSSAGLWRGLLIHLSSAQATLCNAISCLSVVYDYEHFFGMIRLQNSWFWKENVASPSHHHILRGAHIEDCDCLCQLAAVGKQTYYRPAKNQFIHELHGYGHPVLLRPNI